MSDEFSVDRGLELAVVIPTFNERANIGPLLDRLRTTLRDTNFEVIFVDDDSPDGTAATVRAISRNDPKVRVIQRIGRQGLASACIEGMLATSAPYIAVMDADLQHDESVLPRMYEAIKAGGLDVVIGTRNVEGGSMGAFEKKRVMLSTLGSRLSRAICGCNLSDPMSGFFVVDRSFFEENIYRLSGIGFKILIDLVASAQRPVRFQEVPYHFRLRERGESKLDINVGLEYLELLLDKLIGSIVPTRFVLFSMVGAVGVLLHLAILGVLYLFGHYSFVFSQACATLVAMTFNFLLNNVTAFRDRRLRGFQIFTGLIIYYVACSIGAVVNFSFAQFLLTSGLPWYVAGVAGMGVSSVWNYGVNSILIWRRGIRAVTRRSAALARKAAFSAGDV